MSTRSKTHDSISLATLEELLSVGQSLTAVQDLGSLLRKIVKTAGSILRADVIVLYEYHEETGDVVVPPVIWGNVKYPEVLKSRGKQRPHKDSAVFKMLEKSQPFYAAHAEKDWIRLLKLRSPEEYTESFVHREGILSSATVRLTADKQRVGVLFVNYRSPHLFRDEEKRTIELFATQAAVAIRNARLLERERSLRHQADMLREVSIAISSAVELKEMAGRILDALGKVVEYNKATMQLVQGDARTLIAYRGFEEKEVAEWLLRPISKDRLITRIAESKRLLILSETPQDPDWEIVPETRNVQSWVGLPLVYGNQTIGLLTLDHSQAGFYTPAIEGLLVSFAHQAAIAVKNALLLDDAQRRIRDLQILNDVEQIMATKLNTPELLQAIVTQVAEKLNCTHCTFFFPQEERGETWLIPRVIHGKYKEQIASRRFKPGDGLAGWAFEHGESLVLEDARSDPRFAQARERKDLPRSMLVAPVKVGDQTVGVISADQDQYSGFSQSDLRLVDALARQAGIAIQRNRGLELVQTIGDRINSVQEVDKILQLIVSGVIDLTNTTSGVIYLVSEDRQSVTASYKYPPDSVHPAPRMDNEMGTTCRVIATGEVIIFPNARQDEHVNPALRGFIQSMIAVPLKHEEKVIGVLYLNDKNAHDFNETEVSLLSTLANQAAMAIYKTRLLADLERQVKRHRTLNKVGAELAGMLDEVLILDAVARSAADTLDCTHCSVFRAEGSYLIIKASRGIQEHVLQPGKAFRVGQGVAGWVAQTGKSALVPVTHDDPRFDPSWSSPPPEALVVAPILLDRKVYGVISVEHQRPRAFDEQDLRLLETFALHVSQAVRSARRIHDLEVLNRAGHLISSQLNIDQLSETLLDTVNDTLNCLHSTLFIVESTGELVAQARRGYTHPDFASLRFRVGEGLVGWVAQRQQSLNVPDVDKDERSLPIYLTIPPGNPHSMLLAPMLRQNRVMGVLTADKTMVDGFDESDQRLLETLASQAAVAYENARLFKESIQRAGELSLLRDVSAGFMTLNLDELLQFIVKGAMRLTNTEFGIIYLVSDDNSRIVQAVGHPQGYEPRLEISEGGLTRHIITTGEPIFIPDVSKDPRVGTEVNRLGIKCFIGQPLRAGNRTIGVLYLNDKEFREFSLPERDLIATLASQAAIAIENARLYEQRIRDRVALSRIVEIVGTIGAEADPLPIILEETVKLFGKVVNHGTFALVNPDAGQLVFQVIWEEDRVMIGNEIPGDKRTRDWDIGITGRVARTGESYRTGDVTVDLHYKRWRETTVSELVVPLKAGDGDIIGILNLESPVRDAFSEAEETLCQDLANVAAIAIEKGQLFGTMQQLNRQIEGLHRVVQEGSTEQVLDRTLEGINEVLGEGASSSINLYDEGTRQFSGSYRAAGILREYLQGVPPRPQGTSRHVLETGQPYYLDDVCKPPPGSPTIRQESIDRGVKSFAALPLKRQEKIVGMLFINMQKPFHFSEEIMRFLELYAGQAAIAIENARLYDELRRQVRYLDVLNWVATKISAMPDRQEIFETVVKEVNTTLGAVRCTLFILNEAGLLLPQATEGVPPDAAAQLAFRLGEGLAGWVAQEGQAIQVADVNRDPRFVPDNLAAPDVPRPMVLAPLWVEGKVIGVISADRDGGAAFDEIEQRFLETLGLQVGILIRQENLRIQKIEAVKRRFNPYIVGLPIHDSRGFFGRTQFIQEVMDGIHNNNYIIYGERRIGKTSLLCQLEYHLERLSAEDETYHFLPVLATLAGVPEEHFFSFLIRQIARASMVTQDELLSHMDRSGYNHNDLETDLEMIVQLLEQRYQGKQVRIVLLLDEMDQFASYSQTIHEYFRSVFMTRSGTHLKMIMAGVLVQRVTQARTSPWYNLFKEMELDPLDETAARQLVIEPVRGHYTYDEGALESLLEYSDLKPCEIQRLCFLTINVMLDRARPVVIEAGQEMPPAKITVQKEDVQKALGLALQEKNGEYWDLWKKLNDAQRQVLRNAITADGQVDVTATHSDGTLVFSREDLYNITRLDGDQARLTYLFAQWLKGSRL